ncbi:unnamed protein product [Paramecium sonneborni]|uniref:Uncharacterized protein n=1 Tax=Paramecium sonneborni TaxID=65129 RepID=A0A8S1RPK1_9CILI|nr:unnamed protein product [Paramecium sonneborni]
MDPGTFDLQIIHQYFEDLTEAIEFMRELESQNDQEKRQVSAGVHRAEASPNTQQMLQEVKLVSKYCIQIYYNQIRQNYQQKIDMIKNENNKPNYLGNQLNMQNIAYNYNIQEQQQQEQEKDGKKIKKEVKKQSQILSSQQRDRFLDSKNRIYNKEMIENLYIFHEYHNLGDSNCNNVQGANPMSPKQVPQEFLTNQPSSNPQLTTDKK